MGGYHFFNYNIWGPIQIQLNGAVMLVGVFKGGNDCKNNGGYFSYATKEQITLHFRIGRFPSSVSV